MTTNVLLERRALSQLIEQRCVTLSVKSICPHFIAESLGEAVEFSGYLPDFGSPKGILIDIVSDPDYLPSVRHKLAAERAGIPVSFINPASLIKDASAFVEALCDWGYFGKPEDLPEALRPYCPPHSGDGPAQR
jgi:hypothetical protein